MRTFVSNMSSAFAALLAIALVGSANAAGGGSVTGADLENGQSIFENGKGDVPQCGSCHGSDGMGDDNLGTPRLAGQLYIFLAKQLDDYANDRRQDTTMYVMNANAKGLSEQDRRDVSAYLNSLANTGPGKHLNKASGGSDLNALKENGTEVGTSHIGKILVNYGVPERGIPACSACHGFNGRGVEPMYPKINEQKFGYLVAQLKKFREGERVNDPLGQMEDEDILNVAAYLTQAPQTTMGNTRMPAEYLP